MSTYAVEVEGLTFRYPDGTLALDDVSLKIAHGEKVALVGANGAGKSTLLLHLNGVLRSPAGIVRVDGLPVNDHNLGQIRAWAGMVFQNPDDQLFSPLVSQDVAFGPLHMGLPDDEVKARVERALAAVGMSGFADRISHHLSVGEKKRVALATILSMNPKIMILDEPSAGLDPQGRRSLIALLQSFEQQTMLISTHDMRLSYALCSRVVVMDHGRIACVGASEVILNDHDLMERYGLETPFGG